MNIKRLNDNVSISSQPTLSDFGDVASQGFRSIINNRPDDETPDQPSAEAFKKATMAAGLEYRHISVVPGKITEADVDGFRAALHELARPILAFCRTGKRSATLWALSEKDLIDRDSFLETCADAGHDLSGLAS